MLHVIRGSSKILLVDKTEKQISKLPSDTVYVQITQCKDKRNYNTLISLYTPI